MRSRFVITALVLCLLATVQYLLIAPALERLPTDYAEETSYNATTYFRANPQEQWQASNLIARRVDQTLVSSATHSIIQGSLHWTNNAGVVEYETTTSYGVDRRTRANLPDFGSEVRTGAYLFPLHTQRTNYSYWDPQFIGGRKAIFDHVEKMGDLTVYVFRFKAVALDESAGYAHLPEVPERYRALTDGSGLLWIEPTTGAIVDYEEQGISYFADPASGKRVADFFRWNDRYTPATKTAKLKKALAARQYINLLEIWLPLGLLLAGLCMFGMALRPIKRIAGNSAIISGEAS